MTKLLSFLLPIILLLNSLSPNEQLTYRNPRLPVDQRVADLLGRMTLEEKIAQTESIWVRDRYKSLANEKGDFSPDQKMQELLKLGLGQLSGVSQAASDTERAAPPYFGKGPRATAIFT